VGSWMTPAVVTAVMAHMNGDHAADNVVICRGLGGVAAASEATMTGMDVHGIDFEVLAGGARTAVRVPFAGAPLRERAQVRAEVTAMFRESCVLLGLEVPDHARGEH